MFGRKLELNKREVALYILIFAVMYTAVWIILIFYCNEILENEDVDRYCFLDVHMSNQLSKEQLENMENELKKLLGDNLEAVSYVIQDEFGLPYLAVDQGEQVASGMTEQLLTKYGAIVDVSFVEEVQGHYPELEVLPQSQVMPYGSAPYFPVLIFSKGLLPLDWQGIRDFSIRTESPMNFHERKQVQKQIEKYATHVDLGYLNQYQWIRKGIRYYGVYIALSVGVFLYCMLAAILLMRFVLLKLKREVSIYCICGAPSKTIVKYLTKYTVGIQFTAFIVAVVVANILVYCVEILEVAKAYWLPAVCMLFTSLSCILYARIHAKKQIKKSCIAVLKNEKTY